MCSNWRPFFAPGADILKARAALARVVATSTSSGDTTSHLLACCNQRVAAIVASHEASVKDAGLPTQCQVLAVPAASRCELLRSMAKECQPAFERCDRLRAGSSCRPVSQIVDSPPGQARDTHQIRDAVAPKRLADVSRIEHLRGVQARLLTAYHAVRLLYRGCIP